MQESVCLLSKHFCTFFVVVGPQVECVCLTYLDLVPLVLCETLVDDLSLVVMIAGSSHLVASVYACHFQIFFIVSCHVLLGLPMFLPSLGLHSMDRLADLVGGSRRMCPIKRLRLFFIATKLCNAVCSEHVITSSFVM